MPFKSKSQMRACYAKQARGEKGWDCKKWAHETRNMRRLPNRVGKRK